MRTMTQEFLDACEVHSPSRLQSVLDAGLDVRAPINGLTPVNLLLEMYFRSDAFPACLAVLLHAGATLDDPRLQSVLLNDPVQLTDDLARDPTLLVHRTSLRCAFTPLVGASLLHVAAEYGHRAAAEVLLAHGADVEARAAVDAHGLNGHTPIFHTVNSHANRSAPVLELLLSHGARTDVLLPGITWGHTFPWATTCFDVTPISYAQLGALRQFQRSEERRVRQRARDAGGLRSPDSPRPQRPQRVSARRVTSARLDTPSLPARRIAPSSPTRYSGTMRPLRYSINVTLDGCCDHRVGIPDEQLHEHAIRNIAWADALLFGRVTYEMMEVGWRNPPTDDRPEWMEPFAKTIDAARKYVVSSTIGSVDWNAEILRGDLAGAVQQLKEIPGKGILTGGVTLPRALAALDLIDEYEILVHPRIAGHGPKLFDGLPRLLDLKLVNRIEFGSGVMVMQYEPRR